MYPAVGMATLSQYKREFVVEASAPTVFECVTKLFINLIAILGDFYNSIKSTKLSEI